MRVGVCGCVCVGTCLCACVGVGGGWVGVDALASGRDVLIPDVVRQFPPHLPLNSSIIHSPFPPLCPN